MAGYARQAIADIVPNEVVRASPLNAEFNALQDSFSGTTGHTHSGALGDGPKIPNTSFRNWKVDATANPTTSNDASQNYAAGSVWVNVTQDRIWLCVDPTNGAAIWREVLFSVPFSTNSVDIGTSAVRYKDAFLSGVLTAANIAATTFTGTVAMGGNKITGLGTPAQAEDAATKAYADSLFSGKVDKAGDTMSGILNMGSNRITNVASPISSGDAANKGYVDTQVSSIIDAAPGALDTLNELAAALGDDPNFATTVTNSLAGKLDTAGGTMSGNIDMGTNRVRNLGSPLLSGDSATKEYVDSGLAGKLGTTGGTLSGNLAMGGNKITGLGTPTLSGDAVTKNYVDTAFASTTSAAESAAAAQVARLGAEAALDSFDDRYLGPKTSNPTVDNDGNPLLNGALYFNSVAGNMRVYNTATSAWVVIDNPAPWIVWQFVSTTVSLAIAGYGYIADTSGGAFTITLPASPVVGTQIAFADAAGTFATNNLTVARNGNTINGTAADLICDVNRASFALVWSGSTWRIV